MRCLGRGQRIICITVVQKKYELTDIFQKGILMHPVYYMSHFAASYSMIVSSVCMYSSYHCII